MTGSARPPAGFAELARDPAAVFGTGATAGEAYGLLTVDVPAASWTDALRTARDRLGCDWFDWLSAVDEPGSGFQVCAHLAALGDGVRHLLLRTTVDHECPELPTATGLFAGAAWHERETHEMFGVVFTGHPGLTPLLLPDSFEGHPLRKDFVLAARVAKAWPGAKEPGESDAGRSGTRRRQMLPPGVPDPNEWGPRKGQVPPAPARPARRARTAGQGSASQRPAPADRPADPARRTPDAPWERPPGDRPERGGPPPGAGDPPERGGTGGSRPDRDTDAGSEER